MLDQPKLGDAWNCGHSDREHEGTNRSRDVLQRWFRTVLCTLSAADWIGGDAGWSGLGTEKQEGEAYSRGTDLHAIHRLGFPDRLRRQQQ
jgi:hypothetical protein